MHGAALGDHVGHRVDAVAAHAGASAQELVEAVPDAVAERGAVHDDICLLSFRLRG